MARKATPSKKSAVRRKPASGKPASKKASSTKAAPRKAAAKKPVAKKPAAKKPAPSVKVRATAPAQRPAPSPAKTAPAVASAKSAPPVPRNVVLPWSLDGHCDSIILRFVNGDPLDLSPVARDYHVTVPRLLDGRLMALFAMVGDKRLVPSLQMIDRVHRVCREHSDRFSLCLTASEVRTAAESGRIAIVMTIEGQSMFDEHIEHVGNWHRLGVRIFSLTHGEGTMKVPTALQQSESYFGYLSQNDRDRLRRQHKGLTAFARESLREMGRLGIACDLAHANDATFWEVMELATGPVCFTHGNCYALCPHSRNLTDEMLKALAQKGGVVGPCFYGTFVHQTQPTLDRYVGHILHALEIMGPDGVGIGTDFDGVGEGAVMVVPNPSRMGDLWEALDKRGVPSSVLRKIAHDNFMRMLPA